jgi:hypothetical protein
VRVRFWGTRGSLPVALTAPQVRDKLIRALSGAAGKRLDTPEQIRAYVDGLDFATAGTFGGHSPCVQVDVGADEYLLCDMGRQLPTTTRRCCWDRRPTPTTTG